MVDREIFTYLKNVWNNPFGVDVLLVEKPGAWFAQAETENCPRVKSYIEMQVLFLIFYSSLGVFLTFF